MRIPKLSRNSDGRCFSTWPRSGGKRVYFGRADDPESERKYQQWLSRLLSDEAYCPPVKAGARRTIAMLVEEHLVALESLAQGAPGWDRRRSDFANQVLALKPLVSSYGDMPADEFGPKLLGQLQRLLIQSGLSRSTINARIGRVKRCFKWAASQELVPAAVHWGLSTVSGLRKGRTAAKERPPVRPVPWSQVAAVLPHVSPTVAAMIQIQFFAGMRPGEVCLMRPCDLDRTGEIWLFRPAKHKNAWREQTLVKAIPRLAQPILRPLLEGRAETDYLFSPRDVEAWRRDNAAETVAAKGPRKTPVYPCERKRRDADRRETERRRAASPRKRNCYSAQTYYQAIQHGFDRAERGGVAIERWHPNQLRHAVATQIDGWFGRQAAQRWLGHAKLDTTGIYVEQQVADLITLARQLDQRWEDPAAPTPVTAQPSAG